jgi:hypothetical protein
MRVPSLSWRKRTALPEEHLVAWFSSERVRLTMCFPLYLGRRRSFYHSHWGSPAQPPLIDRTKHVTDLLIKSATPLCTNDDRKSVACVAK